MVSACLFGSFWPCPPRQLWMRSLLVCDGYFSFFGKGFPRVSPRSMRSSHKPFPRRLCFPGCAPSLGGPAAVCAEKSKAGLSRSHARGRHSLFATPPVSGEKTKKKHARHTDRTLRTQVRKDALPYAEATNRVKVHTKIQRRVDGAPARCKNMQRRMGGGHRRNSH